MKDGSFGPFETIEDGMKHFQGMIERADYPKALHIGTKVELDEIRSQSLQEYRPDQEEKAIKQRLADLEAKVSSMEQPKSSLIHLPTQQEIMQIVKDDLKR